MTKNERITALEKRLDDALLMIAELQARPVYIPLPSPGIPIPSQWPLNPIYCAPVISPQIVDPILPQITWEDSSAAVPASFPNMTTGITGITHENTLSLIH